MRFYAGKRIGKTSFGVSFSADKIFKWIGYLIFWPFVLIYWIVVWILRASKKKSAAQPARASSATARYSVPGDVQTTEKEALEDATPVGLLPTRFELLSGNSRKFYQEAKNEPYVVIDVETTGLDRAHDRIIELSMICCEDGAVTRWSSLFDPGIPVPDQVTKLTGISEADVAGAPKIEDRIDEIVDFIGERKLVAHNASFDAEFLCRACSRVGKEGVFAFYDTVALARKAFPYMRDYKLNTLIQALDLFDGPQTHRAGDDAECTQKLFVLCVDRLLKQKEKELDERRAKKAAQTTPKKPTAPVAAEPVSSKKDAELDDLLSDLSWLD